MHKFTSLLIQNSEEGYREFSKKLIPSTKYEILGVRVPIIKKIASEVYKDTESVYSFLAENHKYYEEWFLHGIIITKLKLPLDKLLPLIDEFLPFIDNWAVCDSFVASLKQTDKCKNEMLLYLKDKLKSKEPYTIRFVLSMFIDYYTDKEFFDTVSLLIKDIKSDHYYVNMGLAWLYSELLVKNYDNAVKIIERKTLPQFVQNKSIQKACESFRITPKQKEYLKILKV